MNSRECGGWVGGGREARSLERYPVSESGLTKFSLLDVFAAPPTQPVGISFFYLGSRSAFWVAFCVFVEATIFSTSVRPPNFLAPKQKRSRLLHVENSDTIR